MDADQLIGRMAVAIALPGFNNLGRSVTPIFLLMDHFLYRFKLSKKMKIEFFAKYTIKMRYFWLFAGLSVRQFQVHLEGLHVVKTFGITCATDPLLQNMIVCLL